MNWKVFFIPFFLVLAFSKNVEAQNDELSFTLVKGNSERPLKKITAIAQDPQGYIWLCGQRDQCLYRYDGNHFLAFSNDDRNPNSLGLNSLETIFADDSGKIWIGGNGLDQYDPATGIFKHYRHVKNDPETLGSQYISAILKDHKGRIWIGTDAGLDRLDEKTGKFYHYRNEPGNPATLSSNVVRALYEDRKGVIWVGTGWPFIDREDDDDGGLNRLNEDGSFTRFVHIPGDPQSLINNKVKGMFEDSNGNFWVGTGGDGLHLMDREKGIFKRYPYDPARPDRLSRPPLKKGAWDFITYIDEDSTGSLWIGTFSSGLNRYDTVTKKVTHFEGSNGFPDSSCWNGFISRDGTIWIASQGNGTEGSPHLYRTVVYPKRIKSYFVDGGVQESIEDQEGDLWVAGTKGLMQLDHGNNLIQQYRYDPNNPFGIQSDTINALLLSGPDSLWIGSDNGVDILNIKTGKFSRFLLDEASENSRDTIWHIYRDRQGKIWFASRHGAIYLDIQNGTLKRFRHDPQDSLSLGSDNIIHFFEDRSGKFWLGLLNGGIDRFEPETGHFRHYLTSLNGLFLYEDSSGILWAGMAPGLYRYEKSADKFLPFFESQSPFNHTIFWGNMMEDPDHYLWTNNSSEIIRINPGGKGYQVFGRRFGIELFSTNPNANYATKEGKLIIGNYNGFYLINPEDLIRKTAANVHITSLYINNLSISPGNSNSPEYLDWENGVLRTKFNQNNIAFDFSILDFTEPEFTKYFTRLENYDDVWREAPANRNVQYFSLPPGDYIFHVRAIENDGSMSEESLSIHIMPPWYKTRWAYGIYAILLSLAVYILYRYQKRRIIEKERQKAQEIELEQAKEIEKAYHELRAAQAQLIQSEKMASLGELTAGIAHEIQNPLNFVNNFSDINIELIEEVKEALRSAKNEDAQVLLNNLQNNEEKIRLHGQRADAIVKSMLQHSRTNTGQKSSTDINALADEYLRLAYHGMRAKDKNFNSDIQSDFDESVGKINIISQEIGRVMLNLFNNAFYAVMNKKKVGIKDYEPRVSVTTRKIKDKVEISVRDNGQGIPAELADKIFQPFFTTKPTGEGTGLGLSLSYDIVKAHGGEIHMNTVEGEFAQFTISLPA